MSHRLRKLRLLTLPVIACLLFSACQSAEPAPEPDPSATTDLPSPTPESPSPTASPDPTPKPATAEGPAENIPIPEMPELARENSKAGAMSFAEHYFDIINYSTATTTTAEMKKLTSRQCELCATRFIDPLDAADRNNAWQVGGLYDYDLIDLIESAPDSVIAIFNYSVEPQQVYLSPGEVVREWREQKDQIVSFQLVFDGSWKVNQLVTPER